jgi:hypothetical protein
LKKTYNDFVTDIFGLKSEKVNADGALNDLMELLISLRNDARSKKDFATSDKIRNDLLKAGIQLKDGKEGTMWEYRKMEFCTQCTLCTQRLNYYLKKNTTSYSFASVAPFAGDNFARNVREVRKD